MPHDAPDLDAPRPAFRRATPDDMAGILAVADELQAQHHAAHPEVFVPPGNPDSYGEPWRELLRKANGAIFVAEVRGRVAGYVAVDVVDEAVPVFRPARIGRVQSIAVTEAARGCGLGRGLMAVAEAWAASRGATQVQLSVWAFNARARALYEELGFEVRAMGMWKVLPDRGPEDD